MFKFLTSRIHSMGLLTKLFNEAERLANSDGQREPGAEHMVMAALTSTDDTSARRALAAVGGTPESFWAAVDQQYVDALASIGIQTLQASDPPHADHPAGERRSLYRSSASLQDLMDFVTANKKAAGGFSFTTAEIILGATLTSFGVVARALKLMDIDRDALRGAAEAEIAIHRSVK